MKTDFIYDNHGQKTEIIKGLSEGDALIAISTYKSKGDIGMSGLTFDYEAFIVGKEYKVGHMSSWDGVRVAYVVDEDGTSTWATPQLFMLKEEWMASEKLKKTNRKTGIFEKS